MNCFSTLWTLDCVALPCKWRDGFVNNKIQTVWKAEALTMGRTSLILPPVFLLLPFLSLPDILRFFFPLEECSLFIMSRRDGETKRFAGRGGPLAPLRLPLPRVALQECSVRRPCEAVRGSSQGLHFPVKAAVSPAWHGNSRWSSAMASCPYPAPRLHKTCLCSKGGPVLQRPGLPPLSLPLCLLDNGPWETAVWGQVQKPREQRTALLWPSWCWG